MVGCLMGSGLPLRLDVDLVSAFGRSGFGNLMAPVGPSSGIQNSPFFDYLFLPYQPCQSWRF